MANETDIFVEQFFAPPNQLRLEDFKTPKPGMAGDASRLFTQLLVDARAADGRPILLPRVDEKGTLWYALLPDRRTRQVIVEDISSFVGASYADLRPMFGSLDHDDPIDRIALERVGSTGAVLRFRVPPDQRASAIKAIAAMRQAWDERPRHPISTSAGTAALLRALNRAIVSGDPALAGAALDRVRASGRLSSANVTFATIRVLEIGGRWSEILELEELGVVLAIPRPRVVTEALLRAVYWTEVASDVSLDEAWGRERVDAALVQMRDAVLPRYATLFRAVDGLHSDEALLMFALRAAAANPPRPDEVERLAELLDSESSGRAAIERLREFLGEAARSPTSTLSESPFVAEAVAAELRRDGETRKARVRAAQLALEAFGRGPSLETAVEATATLHSLSPDERAELLAIHRYVVVATRLEALVPPGNTTIPDGWVPWATGMRSAPDWAGASEVLEFAADAWTIEPLLQPAAAEDFALTIMEARSQGARDATARALDYLLPAAEAAVSRGAEVSALGSRLVTVLLAEDVVTDADWNFIVGLLDAVLSGVDRNRYSEILDEVRSTLSERASPAMIDPALATLEVAAFHPVADRSARDALASVVIGICERFAHRIHRDQLAILEIACKDLGGSYEEQARDLIERSRDAGDVGGRPLEDALNGQVIGIYSLEEAAAVRAKTAIESAYPGVRVETDASHVATHALRRLAQSANQMIVATRAAKHAATGELETILRKRGMRPIYPAGKGATSMIRALRERVAET